MLGFGGNVADLKATLTLDDDGFIRGMSDASAKLDAYNAKLKEQSVGGRLATMASRDYAKQLYNEARATDNATASHGRLYNMLQTGQRHWKLLGVTTVGVTAGIIQMTGAFGGLSGVMGTLGTAALPLLTGALTALLVPFTSLAAVAVAATGPLTVFSTVLGGIGLGAVLGFKNALASSGPQFAPFRRAIDSLKDGFGTLTGTLAKDFMPWFMKVAPIAADILGEFQKLANMAGKNGLNGLFKGLTQGGFARLNSDMIKLVSPIGDVITRVIALAFGKGGQEGQSLIQSNFSRFGSWVEKAFAPIIRWFDKQHFTATGARWAAELVASAGPVIAHGLWNAITSMFGNLGAWGKLGMLAGAAFAAQFFSAGLLGKGLLAGGKGIFGLLGGGGAAAGAGGAAAGVEGVAGGAAAGGVSAATLLAVPAIAAAVLAYFVYKAPRQTPKATLNMLNTPTSAVNTRQVHGVDLVDTTAMRNQAAAAEAYWKVLNKLNPEQKALNQFISDGGKSAAGWKIAMGQATNQGTQAEKAIAGLAKNGFISASKAASDSKAVLGTYVSQEQAIAANATRASNNTTKFGAAARAQYAHVAALARTSAQLAAAIGSIPSRKYVSLVLSITENLQSQGRGKNSPIKTAAGGLIRGGVPNRDSVPILAMPGEVVLSKAAVAALGGPYAANMLNPGAPLVGMASGGIINYSGGVPAGKVAASWAFKPGHKLATHEADAVKQAKHHLHAQLAKATTAKERHAAYEAYNHAMNHAKAAHRGGVKAAGEAYYQRIQQGAGNWESLEQSSQDPNMNATLLAMYKRQLSFIKGGLAWARKHKFSEGQWLWDARNLENTIAGQKQQQSQASAQEIASFLSEQQGFLSEFAGNIILPGAAALLSGSSSSSGSSGGSGVPGVPNRTLPGRGGVTIHNHFTQTPPDTFVHIRKAKLQAAAVFG